MIQFLSKRVKCCGYAVGQVRWTISSDDLIFADRIDLLNPSTFAHLAPSINKAPPELKVYCSRLQNKNNSTLFEFFFFSLLRVL